MDSGFAQNKSEFAVNILPVFVKMFSHGHGLLDKVVQVLWDAWGAASLFEDSQYFFSGQESNLWDTVSISHQNTNLTWGQSFLGVSNNQICDI